MELSNQRRNDRFPSARAVAHTLPKRDPGSPPAPHDSTHTYIAIVDPRHQAPKSARPRAFPARVWVGFGAWPSCGASTTSRRLPWGFESQGKSSRAFAFRSRIFLPYARALLSSLSSRGCCCAHITAIADPRRAYEQRARGAPGFRSGCIHGPPIAPLRHSTQYSARVM